MAKEKQKQEQKQDAEPQKNPSGKTAILQWAVLGVVVMACAASGVMLGKLFAGSRTPESQTQNGNEQEPPLDLAGENEQADRDDVWYHNLQPIVANLNEPKVTRYARVTLTLAISKEMDEEKGVAFLEVKKPYITNWLTIYLASQQVDDIRGDKNLKRIQMELANLLNEKLFPETQQYIDRVLIQEFAVQ